MNTDLSCDFSRFPLRIIDAHRAEVWVRLVDIGEEELAVQLLSLIGSVPLYWNFLSEAFAESELPRDEVAAQASLIETNTVLEEIRDGNLEFLLDAERKTEDLPEGWCIGRTLIHFAKDNGLSPGQAFKVRLAACPETFETECGEESDVQHQCEVLEREAVCPVAAAQRWEKFSAADASRIATLREAMRQLTQRRLSDHHALYVSRYHYGESCEGVALALCSRHTRVEGSCKVAHAQLLEARNDRGDEAKCAAEFIALIEQAMPGVNVETLRSEHGRRWRLPVEAESADPMF